MIICLKLIKVITFYWKFIYYSQPNCHVPFFWANTDYGPLFYYTMQNYFKVNYFSF